MGLFDAFKGMFGGKKTDVPVNIDNANNAASGVNPMIPSSSPTTASPEIDNETSGVSDPVQDLSATDNSTSADPTGSLNLQSTDDQSATESITTDNVNNGDAIAANVPASEIETENAALSTTPVSTNVAAQISTDLSEGGDSSDNESVDVTVNSQIDPVKPDIASSMSENNSTDDSLPPVASETSDSSIPLTQDDTVSQAPESLDSTKEDSDTPGSV